MIDLPPDSLGPKPTQTQMDVLMVMAEPGATVHTWTGCSLGSGGAYIDFHVEYQHKTRACRLDIVEKFVDWGWLQSTKSDFKGCDYTVTDRGRKVIEKGEVRK